MGAGNLWTPDRDIPLDVKDSQSCDPSVMKRISEFHDIAQQHGIQLVCLKCGVPFQGLNNGHARTWSIFCKCREIKAVIGSSIVPGR